MGADDQNVETGITGTGSGRRPASSRACLAGAAAARSPVALPREQRRARRIAMGNAELDALLTEQRTCRVATASQDGPHLTPLWYAWDGTALWLYSVVRSQRWTDISRDRRVAVLVDAGDAYGELRGAELRGVVEIVGRGTADRDTRRQAGRARAALRPQVRRHRCNAPHRPSRLAAAGS